MTVDLSLSAPYAYEAVYTLLQAAGQAQSPVVPVELGEILNYEPATIVLVNSIERHTIDIETLGTYSQIESYSITGYTSYYQGNTDVAGVTTQTWNVYQSVVMQTIVNNRGQGGVPVLNIPDGTPSPFQVLPEYARFQIGPGVFRNGQQGGIHGVIEWSFACKAYITLQ